jgi:hypothetical protein
MSLAHTLVTSRQVEVIESTSGSNSRDRSGVVPRRVNSGSFRARR